jgi:putative flippase GtrA
VGVLSTVVHLGLFAVLSSHLGSAQAANFTALLLATVVNTALNRRWTFGVRGGGAARHQLQGLAVFGVTWLMTAGALGLLHSVDASPATWLQTLAVAVATAASTVVRFVALRSWIFRPRADQLAVAGPDLVTVDTRTPARTPPFP